MTGSFVGPTKDILRELSIENARKIFTYNIPVMILFRNTSDADFRYYDQQILDSLNDKDVSRNLLVISANVNSEISQKF